MKRLIILLLLSAILSGCVENPTIKDHKYTAPSGSYVTLHPDGTFYAYYYEKSGRDIYESSQTGTYELTEDKLILTFKPSGIIYTYTRAGEAIKDREGILWQ